MLLVFRSDSPLFSVDATHIYVFCLHANTRFHTSGGNLKTSVVVSFFICIMTEMQC